MLTYSMNVSLDGYIADRNGDISWGVPSEEQFAVHVDEVRQLGAFLCGRRLYETMLPWETDPALRGTELESAFADAWCAVPKIVFSRTLDTVEGNARLAERTLVDEASAATRAAGGKDVAVGGAGLAGQAVELGLVDDFRLFRNPVVVGGGTPFFPPLPRRLQLELVGSRTFASRVVHEHYRTVRT